MVIYPVVRGCSSTATSSAFLFSLMLWTTVWELVLGLVCPPCDKIHCSPKRPEKLQCKGGVTTGVCGCCPACAKLEGEKCGGDFAYLGKCDRNLHCFPTSTFLSKSHTLQTEPIGVCKKMTKKRAQSHQADAAFPDSCQPKCSVEFCKKRPRAVCSASDVADTIIDCHGKCQHTSCRACTLTQEPTCPACARDDFRCLKKFGKCMQKYVCSSRKTLCKWTKSSKKPDTGKFVCKVPGCL